MNVFALEESIFFSFGFEWDSPKIKGLEYVSKGLTGVGEGKREDGKEKKKGISVHLSSHNQFIELSIFLNYHSFIANCMKVTDILVVNNKHWKFITKYVYLACTGRKSRKIWETMSNSHCLTQRWPQKKRVKIMPYMRYRKAISILKSVKMNCLSMLKIVEFAVLSI